jgi:phosphoribulokinase
MDNIMKGVTAINNWFSEWYHYISEDSVKRYSQPKTFKEITRQKEQSNPEFNKRFHGSAITNENIIFKGVDLGVFDSTVQPLVRSKDGVAKLWPGMVIHYLMAKTHAGPAPMGRK